MAFSNCSNQEQLQKILNVFPEVDTYNIQASLATVHDLGEGELLSLASKCWNSIKKHEMTRASGLSQYILDVTWEYLNIGHWKDVDKAWRQLYSIASLYKAVILLVSNHPDAAMKACDMGLLMGAPVMNNILVKFGQWLSTYVSASSEILPENCTKMVEKRHSSSDSFHKTVKQVKLDTFPVLKSQYTIKKLNPPSLLTFQETYMDKEEPLVIQNGINHWPAFTNHRWSIEYIQTVAGHRTVPVELGSKYTADDWTQKLMSINEFVDGYLLEDCSSDKTIGYLAQHELFEQVPELKNDICVPDYCCMSNSDNCNIITNAWFGPQGTVSPLHYDPYSNLLAQVMGRKYVRLYDRKFSANVYPHESKLLHNTSQVDVEDPDDKLFPKFLDAPYFECILEEGEMLYIPPKWWHYVRSLSVSFSVSFWWS